MNFCRDCKHIALPNYGDFEYAKCTRSSKGFDPVSGAELGPYYCSSERGGGNDNDCGKEGRFFEPKAVAA